jgi:hypothetical protein
MPKCLKYLPSYLWLILIIANHKMQQWFILHMQNKLFVHIIISTSYFLARHTFLKSKPKGHYLMCINIYVSEHAKEKNILASL